jgi:TetR/AcrR family transcriptional regulator, regulator of autoinduction and epiphytic fitness
MAERVKTRRYDSPRRRKQAAATRLAILEAAERLFVRDGYAATTMAAIAREAGVALKTVYVVFETKSGLLRALWHLRLRGDEEDVPMGERLWYRTVLAEPDTERALRLGAHQARLVKERAGALMGVIRSAALVDTEVRELWDRIESDFYANQRVVVQSLHERGALRVGVARGADIMWTLNHPDVWQLLVGERGWTPDEWEQWFADTVCAQLLLASPS